jgi:transcriptional regulator with PAS, ATPase and Fis domain
LEIKSDTESGPEETKVPERQYCGTLKSVLEQVEKEYIRQVLNTCKGQVSKAAEELGIHRSVLYRKMKR